MYPKSRECELSLGRAQALPPSSDSTLESPNCQQWIVALTYSRQKGFLSFLLFCFLLVTLHCSSKRCFLRTSKPISALTKSCSLVSITLFCDSPTRALASPLTGAFLATRTVNTDERSSVRSSLCPANTWQGLFIAGDLFCRLRASFSTTTSDRLCAVKIKI